MPTLLLFPNHSAWIRPTPPPPVSGAFRRILPPIPVRSGICRWITALHCLVTAVLLFLPPAVTGAETITLDVNGPALAAKWQEKIFVGRTNYSAGQVAGIPCIRATSNAGASGLYYSISYLPQEYPYLSWSWEIERVLQNGDARKKSGDDYAARLYVVFPSLLFWNTRVLNYIWANKLPRDQAIASPYTKNSTMIAVETGNQKAGTWVTETRNIVEDYRRAFGEEPSRIGTVAIMTDTDNTRESTSACYGAIKIMPRAPSP